MQGRGAGDDENIMYSVRPSDLIKPLHPSPDSVILTPASNFGLFSSSSARGDRCSFASDPQDHDSPVFEISQHLEAHVHDGGTHPDPNNKATVAVLPNNHSNTRRFSTRKPQTVNATLQVTKDHVHPLGSVSARNSSASLQDFDSKRSTISSPRLSVGGVMRKTTAAPPRRSGAFPSPGTANYWHNGGGGIQKGWSSERIPAGAVAGRRQVGSAAAFGPFGNGRPLPSKWEDAERWIFSPAYGDGGGVRPTMQQPVRKPKSKSGPLGPPGAASNPLCSPAIPTFNRVSFTAIPGGGGGDFPLPAVSSIVRSASIHGCTEMLGSVQSSSFSSSRGEKSTKERSTDETKHAADIISHAVSRRDMATQKSPTSPGSSSRTSSERRLTFSLSTASVLPLSEGTHSSRAEVRDVQVDDRVTVTRWSKKSRGQVSWRKSRNMDASKKNASHSQPAAWDISEETTSMSRVKREEANITAWENLQKAKAEAAIRKLEVKLEKKRSSSMEKILNKLRSAQERAQKLRSLVLADQVDGTSHKALPFRRALPMGSLSDCFVCHAY